MVAIVPPDRYPDCRHNVKEQFCAVVNGEIAGKKYSSIFGNSVVGQVSFGFQHDHRIILPVVPPQLLSPHRRTRNSGL